MGQRHGPTFRTRVLLAFRVKRLKCIWGTSVQSVPLLQEKRLPQAVAHLLPLSSDPPSLEAVLMHCTPLREAIKPHWGRLRRWHLGEECWGVNLQGLQH